MYASVSTIQIRPDQVAAFTQTWREQIEPVINQISALFDLYVLVNVEGRTVLIVGIYTDEAAAIACEVSPAYQQRFSEFTDLVSVEPVTQHGYTVIST